MHYLNGERHLLGTIPALVDNDGWSYDYLTRLQARECIDRSIVILSVEVTLCDLYPQRVAKVSRKFRLGWADTSTGSSNTDIIHTDLSVRKCEAKLGLIPAGRTDTHRQDTTIAV